MASKKDPGGPSDDSDDEARRQTAGREERATFPGIPSRFSPPRPGPRAPLPVADPEQTPPEPIQARRRGLAPPLPQRSVSPVPVSPRTTVTVTTDPPPVSGPPGGAKVSVELAGTRVDFRTKSPGAIGKALWAIAVSALGLGGGAAGAALTHHPDPAPAVDPTIDPCPPSQPLTARSPLCLRLQAAEGAVNSMAWDVEDLKKKLAREHDARVDLEGTVSDLKKSTPHIEGVPKK